MSSPGGPVFFEGTWKAHRTVGEFEQFLSERGVPYPIRKILGMLNNGGKFEYRVEDGAYVETEIGRFSSKVSPPVPLGALKGVDGKAPSGERISKYAKIEGPKLLLTHAIVGPDPEDCVDMCVTRSQDSLFKKFTNRKTGTSFTVELRSLEQPRGCGSGNSGSGSISGTAPVNEAPPPPRKVRDVCAAADKSEATHERFYDVVSLVVLVAYVGVLCYAAKLLAVSLYDQILGGESPAPVRKSGGRGGPFAFLLKVLPSK